MPITQVNGRTFDVELGHPDPASERYPISRMLSSVFGTVYISAEDQILQTQLNLLAARVAVLEGKPPPAPIPLPALWALALFLDQMQTGMCVGYGNTNWLASTPKASTVLGGKGGDDETATPDAVYDAAQRADGSPADPNTGASITGGAKGLKALGYISAYHWAFSVADVVAGLRICPGVMGLNWRHDMFTPNAEGIVTYTGAIAGGHCVEILNHDAKRGLFEIPNSWGEGWGLKGRCFLSEADMGKVLADQGEVTFYTRV